MRKIEKFKAALEALQELGEENLDPQNYVVDVMNWLEESIDLSKSDDHRKALKFIDSIKLQGFEPTGPIRSDYSKFSFLKEVEGGIEFEVYRSENIPLNLVISETAKFGGTLQVDGVEELDLLIENLKRFAEAWRELEG